MLRPFAWTAFVLGFVACGARTALITEGVEGGTFPDASTRTEAGADALPPPIDASRRDANRDNCPDAGETLIYLLSERAELWSFLPPSTSRRIGPVACPSNGIQPFSMAVGRDGMAYSVFGDGNLFKIDTATLACTSTPFVANQQGFNTFGMGFVANPDTGEDTLFVAQGTRTSSTGGGLGRIDTQTFALDVIGPFDRAVPRSELTGTADGRLFLYWPHDFSVGSSLAEVDTSTARIIGENSLNAANARSAFAFAFWGGDFWIFTSEGSDSTVTQYRLADRSETQVATIPAVIVGAGVSTCAPN